MEMRLWLRGWSAFCASMGRRPLIVVPLPLKVSKMVVGDLEFSRTRFAGGARWYLECLKKLLGRDNSQSMMSRGAGWHLWNLGFLQAGGAVRVLSFQTPLCRGCICVGFPSARGVLKRICYL